MQHYHSDLFNTALHNLDTARVLHLTHFCLQSQAVVGDCVEFGVYHGKAATFLATLVDKQWWLYDSFQGFPDVPAEDTINPERFHKGLLSDTSPEEVTKRFMNGLLAKPRIIAKFFRDVQPSDLPEHIAFAHVDGDLYDSILCSLELVYPRLSKGAACVIDDYLNQELPGAKKAVERFMLDKPEKLLTLYGLNRDLALSTAFVKL